MKKLLSKIVSVLLLASSTAQARPNYHTVGWFNMFVLGCGEFLLGNYSYGTLQAGLEVGTFYWGYSKSRLSPISLDGVPETLPTPRSTIGRRRTGLSRRSVNIASSLYADWLQEFG